MYLNTDPPLHTFAQTVVEWQRREGRHHLPWQGTRDPYRIWLSEIMLQQTQVNTVVAYYERFLSRFPDVDALASATQDEVMPYWAGLGYYARARNLHRCAQELAAHHGSRFPLQADAIARLPGIGPSTAAAIAAFAYGERSPIMDGNVKRVFSRYFGIYGDTNRRVTEQLLWERAEAAIAAAPDSLDMSRYTQGLMDLGSTRCTRGRPECELCPLSLSCYARTHSVQAELPTPRVKKNVPQRQCKMLILHRQDSVLLERRPSPGIWGGLWSLPQYEDAAALDTAISRHAGSMPSPQKLAALLHTFTHFKLHIEPWYVQCAAGLITEPGSQEQRWVPVAALHTTALPAPVKTLLEGLFSFESADTY
jgi:A/G-specific adenine glycosylase